MHITIPTPSLVLLIGPSGAGKSTFARAHFKPTEVISSDYCRGLVSDDENSLAATDDAFAVLHFIAAKRLANARLTVIDATATAVLAACTHDRNFTGQARRAERSTPDERPWFCHSTGTGTPTPGYVSDSGTDIPLAEAVPSIEIAWVTPAPSRVRVNS